MKFLIMEDFCCFGGTFFMKLCRENWLSVREALSGWGFYCCFVEFAEIKDNTFKFMLKLCGENWPFLGMVWVFFAVLRFVLKSMIKKCQYMYMKKSVIHYLTLVMCYLKKRKFKNTVINLLERLISGLTAITLCSYNASNCSNDVF